MLLILYIQVLQESRHAQAPLNPQQDPPMHNTVRESRLGVSLTHRAFLLHCKKRERDCSCCIAKRRTQAPELSSKDLLRYCLRYTQRQI